MGAILGLHRKRTISVSLRVQDMQVGGRKTGKNWNCWYETVLFGSKCIGPNDCRGGAPSDQL